MSKSPTSSGNLIELFDQFIAGTTLRSVLNTYHRICQILDLKPGRFNNFYPALKKGIASGNRLNKNWKSQSIFLKIERKASQRIYQCSPGPSPTSYGVNSPGGAQQRHNHHNHHHHHHQTTANALLQSHNCLIIGGGPCGLRTAIELQLLGANHVVIIEKRDRFSRNNVLHLWPFVISDLKQLSGKKFYGKFCAGSIDHVSIRQLQLMLIKVALIIGCEFIENITFEEICPRNLSTSRSCSKHNSTNGSLQSSVCSNNSPNSSSAKRRLSFCSEVVEIPGQRGSDGEEKKDSDSEKSGVGHHPLENFNEEGEGEEVEAEKEGNTESYSNGTTNTSSTTNSSSNSSNNNLNSGNNSHSNCSNKYAKESCEKLSPSKQASPEKEKCQCCCHRHRSSVGSGGSLGGGSNSSNDNVWSDVDPNYIGAYAHFSVTSNNLTGGSVLVDYNALLTKLHRYSFDILIGADGRRNTLADNFPRKEFRGRLAIAITANFINTHSLAEAQIPEISGISFIYNQQLFKALYDETGIDLENICYYKDDTHYFVMTAKKCSLLARGVLLKDYADTTALLAPSNINRTQLLNYARDAARWTTGYEPLNFALNHYGEADVAMFDFTSMYAAENACRAKRIMRYSPSSCICDINNHSPNGHQPCKKIKSDPTKSIAEEEGLLLIALVGDSLLEPFWPTGSGCGRGFLSCMDAAWMVRQWEVNRCRSIEDEDEILKVLSERESIYRLLGQTTSENLSQNSAAYTINPITRYPNLNTSMLLPHQCKYLLYEDPFPSPEMRRKRTLAFKRLRRATIATTTPFTADEERPAEEERTTNKLQEVQSYEESLAAFEENYKGLITNGENSVGNVMSSSVPAAGKLFQQSGYDLAMSPSATNMAQLGKSRAKDIESALRHRRQREQLLRRTDDAFYTHKAAEQQFNNHVQSQLKHKAAWFLDAANHANGSHSYSSGNPAKEVSKGIFSSRVKDLEAKLYAASGLSCGGEQRGCRPIKLPSTKSGSHVMATASTLEQLFDPKNQEKELREKVKKKTDKEIKFVGKLGADDWNFKCWQDKEKATPPPTPKSPDPLPKERVELFQRQLTAMQTKLENIDDKHLPERKATNDENNGEWVNLLKDELKERVKKDHKVGKNAQEIKENIHKLEANVREEKRSSKQCSKCYNPVATVDKIVLNGSVLHRSCLTCSRCGVTLRLSEVRSRTMAECLSADNRSKERSLDYICILCSKNKANNNTLPSDVSDSVNENLKKPSDTIRPTPPVSLSLKNTPLLPADEYEAKIKERIRWKETFLLNNNNIDLRSKSETKSEEAKPEPSPDGPKKTRTTPEPKKLLTERIEYENTSMSFELFDEDELTKLLNLESDQWDSEEEEESSDSGSWEQTDSTDNDFDSDEFDMSENAEANKAAVKLAGESVAQSESLSQATSIDFPAATNHDSMERTSKPLAAPHKLDLQKILEPEKDLGDHSVASKDLDDIDSIDEEVEDIVTPVNAIKEFNFVLKAMQETGDDEKGGSRNSSISSVSCKQGFEDINLVSVVEEQGGSPKKEPKSSTPNQNHNQILNSPKQTYFKVALPKLTVFNFEHDKPALQTSKSFTPTTAKPPSSATYSKIPVLATRVSAAAAGTTATNSSSQRLPAYSGSFTEKMLLRCRSSPSLSQRDVFSRWSTNSCLSSTVSPSIDKSKLSLDTRTPLSFPKQDKKDSPETPSVSKLPFADSDAAVEDVKSPKYMHVRYPVCRTVEAPKASIDEAFDEEDKLVKQLKSKTENVDDEQLLRQWFKLKYKE